MGQKRLSLHFPLGGLDLNKQYQSQPPYTTPAALNVRPHDVVEGRERGGSRPGLIKAFATALGDPSEIRLLAQLNVYDEREEEGYFVDQVSGDDTKNGRTPATAWKTLAKVNAFAFAAGDYIYLKRGCTWAESLAPTASGTAADRIVFSDYGEGDLPIITGTALAAPLAFDEGDYLSFENIHFQANTGGYGKIADAKGIAPTFTDCKFEYTYDAVDSMLDIDSAVDVFTGCEFYTTAGVVNSNSAFHNAYGTTTSVTVTDCSFTNFGQAGIAAAVIHSPAAATTIENCVFEDCYWGIYFNYACGGTIEGNLFLNYGGAGTDNNFAIQLYYHNTNPELAVSVTNNVFIPTAGGGANQSGIMFGWRNDVTIRNNIFYGSPVSGMLRTYLPFEAGTTSDYNCFYDVAALSFKNGATEYTTLIAWQAAATQDANSIQADPTFTDVVGEDFSLAVGSPCIGTGEGGVDMGLYPSGAPPVEPIPDFFEPYYRNMVIASAGGKLYRLNQIDQFEEVTTALTLADDRVLQAASLGQKLYIADYCPSKAYGKGGVVDATGLELTSADVADWTALGININDFVVVLSDVTGATVAQTYKLATIAADKLTLASTAGGAGTCTYRVTRGPKVYDPDLDTLSLWTATSGQVPTGCDIICSYQERLAMAGGDAAHVWYTSRQGDADDWDYFGEYDDYGRAMAGTNSEVGGVGDPLKALVPFSDDYMIMGCDRSLWIMRGNPAAAGRIDNITRSIGIVGKFACAYGPSGELYFLSRDGIYTLAPGGSTLPESISRERTFLGIQDANTDDYSISMAYDVRDRGIHLFLTPNTATSVFHIWLDYTTKSIWSVKLTSAHEAFVSMQYNADDPTKSAVLLGCRDGYIRKFSRTVYDDDGTAFDSYVAIGPIRLGDEFAHGAITEIVGTLGQGSGNVKWSVFGADTAEEAVDHVWDEDTPFDTGTWAAGRNYSVRPCMRAGAMILKLEKGVVGLGDPETPWAIESIGAAIEIYGDQRKF